MIRVALILLFLPDRDLKFLIVSDKNCDVLMWSYLKLKPVLHLDWGLLNIFVHNDGVGYFKQFVMSYIPSH